MFGLFVDSVMSTEVCPLIDDGLVLGEYMDGARGKLSPRLLAEMAFGGTVVAIKYSCRAWSAPGSCST